MDGWRQGLARKSAAENGQNENIYEERLKELNLTTFLNQFFISLVL